MHRILLVRDIFYHILVHLQIISISELEYMSISWKIEIVIRHLQERRVRKESARTYDQ